MPNDNFLQKFESSLHKALDWLTGARVKIAHAFAPTIETIEEIAAEDFPLLLNAGVSAITAALTGGTPVTAAGALVKIGVEAMTKVAVAQEIPATLETLHALAGNAATLAKKTLGIPATPVTDPAAQTDAGAGS